MAPWSTRADVLAKLRKRWDSGEFLTAFAADVAWTPLAVVLKAPKAREVAADFDAVRLWAQSWHAGGDGLRVEYRAVGGRLVGVNELPNRVWVDGYDQLWSILGVAWQARRFAAMVDRTRAIAPELADWMVIKPHTVLAHGDDTWRHIIDTVLWIDEHADPRMYVRQVDVPAVDTKFIEKHATILGTLLDRRLDESRIDRAWPVSKFAERYRFQRKPSTLRFRWLDPERSSAGFSDLEVRVDELARVGVDAATVFVLENQTTYLAFPQVKDAVAIFGGGYSVSRLKPLAWLHDRELVYWGDLDTHGFSILNRLREHFPRTRSMLMDRMTLTAHETQWVREDNPVTVPLDRLTPAEAALYRDLVEDTFGPAVRLEQERVRYSAIEAALGKSGSGAKATAWC